MQGKSFVLRLALSCVEKSLNESVPENIDFCFCGHRVIACFSGKNQYVKLITAEILDNDWIIDQQATKLFSEQVETMIEYRNVEFQQLLKQITQIISDRIW